MDENTEEGGAVAFKDYTTRQQRMAGLGRNSAGEKLYEVGKIFWIGFALVFFLGFLLAMAHSMGVVVKLPTF